MIILITGGSGFIGSNLCKRLLANNTIYCVDNLSSGSIENIDDLLDKNNFHFIKQDIIDLKITLNHIDIIYNLACMASPKYYQKYPIDTMETCYKGTKNILEIAKKYNCKVFHASTSEIYGNPLEHPQIESYYGNVNTFGLRSCYDEGKRISETLCFEYQRLGCRVSIGRIFNTYGPNMSKIDGRVIPNFINQCLSNKDITIYGDGLQTRSLCYIDDLLDVIIKLTNFEFKQPINIGNNYEITILQLAKKIKSLTESQSNIIFKPLPQDDPIKRQPNIDLAKKKINWVPKISLIQGLIKTIDYFKTKI